MRERPISEKRQKLIDEKNASPLYITERITVKYNAGEDYVDKQRADQTKDCIILDFVGDKIKIRRNDNSVYKKEMLITKDDIIGRDIYRLGANPFDEETDSIRPVAFTCDSILFNLNILGTKDSMKKDWKIGGLNILELNWNPYVYNKQGKKEYYQRPFCWTLQDKQLLIESIYQGIDCGKILVRKRAWEELEEMQKNGETELAFNDIVDGKQRLEAMRCFILLEYTDAHGNYFSDLSFDAQRRFTDHQLFMYAEMPERTKDELVIRQFLKMNFCGVPQSQEHINFVRQLKDRVK